MSWLSVPFVNPQRRLRNGWWIVAFLTMLAALLLPVILISARAGREVSIWDQAAIIAVATVCLQIVRRRPIIEVTGRPGSLWLKQMGVGFFWGGLMMLVPALLLTLMGLIRWHLLGTPLMALASVTLLMLGSAIAEELLFRGLLFQRLIAGLGFWPAQLIIAGLFVLTHLNNPGMDGATRIWAATNIFIASLLFGLAYAQTQSLALPAGLHFMANWTQGVLLGFGVSGNAEPSVLSPGLMIRADWLTGGAFGLEASLLGLLAVSFIAVIFWRRRRVDSRQAHEEPAENSSLN